MESAFSPNTTAFINYLGSFSGDTASDDLDGNKNPTSLPPSAFFSMPVPGRDTPEDTPPSLPSVSPEKSNNDAGHLSVSEDSDSVTPDRETKLKRKNSTAGNKRKAGPAAHVRENDGDEEDDEESESDGSPSGHEDKRQHGNDKSGKKGGRKSSGGNEDGRPGKEPNKAARRKEQNRAAQKAFRERREAKVKDLEAKVAELEAKSFGASVENENLRGILKRLQEENVALKQSAFTFTMPVSGTNGTNTPTTSAFSAPQRQAPKPPSPQHTNTDDSLMSINDVPRLSHRGSSASNVDSPESLVSIGSTRDTNPPSLFAGNSFNAFALGGRPASYPLQPQQKQQSTDSNSFSSTSTSSPSVSPPASDQSDINALWASLYPNGVGAGLVNQNQPQQQNTQNQLPPQSQAQQPNNPPSPFTLLTSQPEFMSFANAGVNLSTPAQPNTDFNRFAFRDTAAENNATTNWADITDNSMNDFLASLTGDQPAQDTTADLTAEDDAFNAQLQQIFGNNSPSAAFTLPNGSLNAFSPGNYLNMSPSPLNPVSNSQSPQSSNDKSATGSPESTGSNSSHPTSVSGSIGPLERLGTEVGTFGPGKRECDIVHIVDSDGTIIQPSDMWVRLGMQNDKIVDHLVIDDLCAQMRAKASVKDGKMHLSVDDAKQMFLGDGDEQHHKWVDGVKRRLIGAQGPFMGESAL
ncbi:hypothetical protein CI109_101791 [Kwoniella shandongensis]|uniref:Uncharacterized protein n=1 Tax=Kwoniella shandongensis TaxID=1734106 RepID=A0A5M6C560_9TREE|nr:uncharacterized protein CI109_001087 [Kwoniella shandongensis]KAA5530287.1 hypothetical protein CI109_001087 [Kwoniella shandongensis]